MSLFSWGFFVVLIVQEIICSTGEVTLITSSANVFHSPHDGHLPTHLLDFDPQF